MIKLDQYLDLYLSEAQEHLGTLNQGILDLESGGGGDSLDAAFRAAHTIKGMAAMMGHDRVARIAHRLEDRLDDLRAGRAEVDPELIDELLSGVDELAAAIDAAIAGGESTEEAAAPAEAEGSVSAERGAGLDVPVPDGAELVVRVVIMRDSPLKGARALLAKRNAENVCTVVGTSPSQFDDDFGGEFWLFIGPGADPAMLEEAIRSAGEVESVEMREPATGTRVMGPDAVSAVDDATAPTGVSAHVVSRHVKVDRDHLIDLADGMGDLGILVGRLERVGDEAPPAVRELIDEVVRRVRELQDTTMSLRMVPAGVVFDRLPRVVRDTARALGKEVDFRLGGRDIELDREILEQLVDPLVHILRNAIGHGLESREDRLAAGKPPRGQLELRVIRERSSVLIEVEDDGRGVARAKVFERARSLGLVTQERPEDLTDEDLLRLLSQPGFTTASEVSSVSGRGVGMDAVVTRIRSLGGGVSLRTAEGRGTTFSLRMPVTLALVQALRVRVGDEDYAIPLTHVREALDLMKERVVRRGEREVVRYRGKDLELVRLRAVLGVATEGVEEAAVVTEMGDRRAALAVDRLVGREQIVVKGFDAAVGTLKIFSGAALLADGKPALVLDPISVI